MRIQHNILAMNSYRNYNNNTSALGKNLERLSSGYKINRAGDDAAGLAISEKMRAQITGLEAAQKNVKDGVSLVKTAEGAMQEIQDMLNRMTYLATQSANGTYDSDTDRAALQQEVDALRDEINRIADSANFNGISLLDGSLDATLRTTGNTDLYADSTLEVMFDGQLGNEARAGEFELDLTGFEGTVKGENDEAAGTAVDVKVKIFGQEITITGKKVGDKITGQELADAIKAKWVAAGDNNADLEGTDKSRYKGGFGVNLEVTQNGAKLTFKMDDAPTKAWNIAANGDTDDATGITLTGIATSANGGKGNQSYGLQVKTIVEPVDSSSARIYAQASIDLSKLASKIADGSTLTIGDTTYIFAVDKNSKYKDSENVIDLTDMTADSIAAATATTLGKLASRITTAARDNKNFTVAANSAVGSNGSGRLYLTEKEGGVDTDDYKLEGNPADPDKESTLKDGDWTGLVKFGKVDTDKMGKAMNLQIGDTSEDYNQMKVVIGDMHTSAMGTAGGNSIANIDITTAEDASAAVNVIRDAINYVSSVRGQLGAYQNRLEHTQNNLSVMAENIQDAESTIRDTDVAEEMMSYVKNNILVQSAQAMLAQANQVPQGVLQLLG